MDDGQQERGDQRRCRWLAATYAAGTAAALAVAASAVPALTTAPNLTALAVFAALVIWAENGFVRLPSETSVSPSFMVVMAAIAAFDGRGSVVGAAIVGASGGLVIDLLRRRRFAVMVINCAQFALAGVAAAVAYEAAEGVHAVVGVAAAGAAFGAVNVSMVVPAVMMAGGSPASHVWADMRPALPNYFAFGLLGTLVGELYASLGWLAVVLLMTPVAIARAAFGSIIELHQAHEATIKVFLRAIEAKDLYTYRHTLRVCRYSVYIGEQLGFNHGRLEHLRRAALMHDIGKLAVPKHLLNKPAKLTDDEFSRVQRHAHVCIDILDLVDFLKPMTAAAAGHHARFDGGGYGGTGDFPLEAYIVAVADAYDAMTSTRSYRRALPMEVAFAELRAKSGSQFHPDCVEGLIAAIEARGEKHGLGYETDLVDFDVAPPVAGVGSAGLGDRLTAGGGGDAGVAVTVGPAGS